MIFNIMHKQIYWPGGLTAHVFEIPQRSKQREEEDAVSNFSAVNNCTITKNKHAIRLVGILYSCVITVQSYMLQLLIKKTDNAFLLALTSSDSALSGIHSVLTFYTIHQKSTM